VLAIHSARSINAFKSTEQGIGENPFGIGTLTRPKILALCLGREMNEPHIVIFDGVCNFCNGAVDFIISRDPKCEFVFTPMQSDLAKELTEKYRIDNVGVDTFLLIKNGRCYIWSDAALEIARDLEGFWYLCLIFKVVPRSVRDFFYRVFARNRYALFGRQPICMVPTPELLDRFVGV
jgi:predicted DCC family thiol-disulfide oxidoreductase YuxK